MGEFALVSVLACALGMVDANRRLRLRRLRSFFGEVVVWIVDEVAPIAVSAASGVVLDTVPGLALVSATLSRCRRRIQNVVIAEEDAEMNLAVRRKKLFFAMSEEAVGVGTDTSLKIALVLAQNSAVAAVVDGPHDCDRHSLEDASATLQVEVAGGLGLVVKPMKKCHQTAIELVECGSWILRLRSSLFLHDLIQALARTKVSKELIIGRHVLDISVGLLEAFVDLVNAVLHVDEQLVRLPELVLEEEQHGGMELDDARQKLFDRSVRDVIILELIIIDETLGLHQGDSACPKKLLCLPLLEGFLKLLGLVRIDCLLGVIIVIDVSPTRCRRDGW